MNKEKSIIEFYVLCNGLKDVIRSGWKVWNVQRTRVESVAEHVYGVQMLAIAMWSEFNYDIDIQKVLMMLAIHELEETVIGDITQFEKGVETKEVRGHEAVKKILSKLSSGKMIEDLILEFDKKETKEALFAFQCDKLECDLQSKLYDEQKCVDLKNWHGNPVLKDEFVQKNLLQANSWSEAWLKFGQKKYNYDDNFLAVSNYAIKNDISEKV